MLTRHSNQSYQQNRTLVLMSTCQIIGGFFFLFGLPLYESCRQAPSSISEAAVLLGLGSLFFFTSSCYRMKLYFWEKPAEVQHIVSEEADSMDPAEI